MLLMSFLMKRNPCKTCWSLRRTAQHNVQVEACCNRSGNLTTKASCVPGLRKFTCFWLVSKLASFCTIQSMPSITSIPAGSGSSNAVYSTAWSPMLTAF